MEVEDERQSSNRKLLKMSSVRNNIEEEQKVGHE
jgi:hypothetical protein